MMSLPYSHNHSFPMPLPPPALPKVHEQQPEPLATLPEPVKTTFIPIEDVKTEQPDKLSNNEMVKTYYESKTHGLLIDHQKSNLDLFKIIHQALVSIETKIETLASSIGDLCKVTTQLNDEITKMNHLNDEMNKTLEEMKKKPPPPTPNPIIKPSSSIQRSPSMTSTRLMKK